MSYIDGFVIPVPTGKKEACRAVAAKAAVLFKELGDTRIVESLDDAVPYGRVTDFKGPPGWEEKVMNASFRIGESQLMADDGMGPATPAFKGLTLALDAGVDADTRRLFDTLADGGIAQVPLAKTCWTSSFAMLTDKFGVPRMVMTESSP